MLHLTHRQMVDGDGMKDPSDAVNTSRAPRRLRCAIQCGVIGSFGTYGA